jgi:DNA-binding MarR family transcriptional regulator
MADERQLELARQIITILPQFGNWATAIRDFETPYGKLGYRQRAILWAIRYELIPEKDLSPGSLARQQNVRPSVITRALARLEEGGFIGRAIDLADRRRITLTMTTKGCDVSRYVEELYLREITDAMGQLNRSQMDNLFRALNTLDEIAERLLSSGFGQNHTAPDDA